MIFFSDRYLATGECGINPTIKVWELETSNGNYDNYTGGTIVAEFSGHKYAVSCVVSFYFMFLFVFIALKLIKTNWKWNK